MDNFTAFLIVLGAATLCSAFMWAVLRIGAWVDGREW